MVGPGGSEASLAEAAVGSTKRLACTYGGHFYASADAGKSWRPTALGVERLPSLDCDVAITSDGVWALAYDTKSGVAVATSADDGATWSLTPIAGPALGGPEDRPWLATSGSTLLLTWCDQMVFEPALCSFSESVDRGATWSTPSPITIAAPGKALVVMGKLQVSPDGQAFAVPVAWASGPEPAPDVTFAVELSRDGGAHWTESVVAGPVKAAPQFPSLAFAPDGSAYVSFTEESDAASWLAFVATSVASQPLDAEVLLAASGSNLMTWGRPLVVASHGQFDSIASASVGAARDGTVTVAWLANETDGRWRAYAATLAGGTIEPWIASGNLTGTGGDEFMTVLGSDDGSVSVAFALDAQGCPDPSSRPTCVYVATRTGPSS
ncbi:MAG: sialidase family protein [Thermoplasmatota archaeon]